MPSPTPVALGLDPRVQSCILASRRNGTLYVGVTGDLVRRIHQHRTSSVDGFTRRHEVRRLVHVEAFSNVAISDRVLNLQFTGKVGEAIVSAIELTPA